MTSAVEEMLRYDGPVVQTGRIVLEEDTEIDGCPIGKGQSVLTSLAAANHDPDVYPEPDKFDIRRETDKHAIAFGYGQHFCLGSSLAKLEARVMIGEIVRRLPDMRFAPGKDVVRTSSTFVRGLALLPVVFTPA